ncbi:MAG: LapA family protein [Desulfobacterales bacterium]|nr:LapA family protein [Desulfobacterales bacterium]
MKNPKFIAGLVLAILFLIFLFQNTQVVTLRLYFWKISMSQIILIPLVLVLGFIIGYVVAKVTKKGPALKLK